MLDFPRFPVERFQQWKQRAAQRGTGFTNEAADPCHCLAPFPSRFVIDRGRSTFLETRSLFRLSSARRERGRGAEMDLDVLSRPHLCTCTRPCVSIDRGGKGVLVELLDAASPLVIEAITTRRNKCPAREALFLTLRHLCKQHP